MRKKFLILFLAFCFIIPCVFLFSACDKGQTNNVQVRVGDEYVEWSIDGENWNNIISLDNIKDMLKDDEDFKGENGETREVEFRKDDNYIQWRYVTSDNSDTWKNLVSLDDIKGQDLTVQELEFAFSLNLPAKFEEFYDYFSDIMTTQYNFYTKQDTKFYKTINMGAYVELPIFDSTPISTEDDISQYFLGWFVGTGTDEMRVTSYTSLVNNKRTIEARWDTERINNEYYTYGLKLAFNDTEAFVKGFSLEENSDWFLTKIDGRPVERNIYIPRVYKGKEVTTILDFCNANGNAYGEGTTSFTLSESKHEYGFSPCISVKLPNTILEVDYEAFYYADSLIEVYVPNSVKRVEGKAFRGVTCFMEDGIEFTYLEELAFDDAKCNRVDGLPLGVTMGITADCDFGYHNTFSLGDIMGIYKPNIFIDMPKETLREMCPTNLITGEKVLPDGFVYYDTSVQDVNFGIKEVDDIGYGGALYYLYGTNKAENQNCLYYLRLINGTYEIFDDGEIVIKSVENHDEIINIHLCSGTNKIYDVILDSTTLYDYCSQEFDKLLWDWEGSSIYIKQGVTDRATLYLGDAYIGVPAKIDLTNIDTIYFKNKGSVTPLITPEGFERQAESDETAFIMFTRISE